MKRGSYNKYIWYKEGFDSPLYFQLNKEITMNDKPLTKQEMIKIIKSEGNQRTNFFNNLTEKQIDQLNRFAFGNDFIDEDDESKGSLKKYNEE